MQTTVKLLAGIYPPPPGFGTPACSCIACLSSCQRQTLNYLMIRTLFITTTTSRLEESATV